MCLVEIEKMPKMQTACTTPIAEGMVVQTESEKVVQARKSTLELLLANHPLDCPVCDAGGECELQDMTFKYGAGESKFIDIKSHRDEQQWSPMVFSTARAAFSATAACASAERGWTFGRSAFRTAARDRDRANQGDSSRLRRVRHVHRYLPGRSTYERFVSL